jgi:DNA-binding response OmpR family regulator
MRPKKTIVCVTADEGKLAERAYMLETRGFHVLRVQSTAQAAKLLEYLRESPLQEEPDLLLLHLPLLDVRATLREAHVLFPELRTMVTSDGSGYDLESGADVYLPRAANTAAEIVERARILVARKRGPKKAADRMPGPAMLKDGAA